jgi:hypothetical protein
MPEQFPPIEPYDSGILDAGDGHEVYWEYCGNPAELEARCLRDLLRHEFGHALDDGFRTRFAYALRHSFRHLLDVAIARIIKNENFCHGYLLAC